MVPGKQEILDAAIPYRPICGVYFLISQGELVYVGQSADVVARVSIHNAKKIIKFDSYNWIECISSELTNLEIECILKFRPSFNKNIPECKRFTTAHALKRKGLGRVSFKKYLASTSCTHYVFNSAVYYDLQELKADQVFVELLETEGVSL